MPDTAALRTESSIAAALLEALGSAGDPTLILGPVRDHVGVIWGNRVFAETIRAEVADLDAVSINDLMVCPFGELPLNERRAATFPVAVVGRDGSTSSWEATAIPARTTTSTTDGGTAAMTWVVTLRPPTADGQLDELLRASEERFRALAERAPIGIFSSEVGLRLGYVNDGLAELVGSTSEKLLGTGWMDFVLSSDLERIMAGLQSTLEGVPFDTPARLITTEGEERWVNLRAVPVRAIGTPAAFLGTIEDVTDRRRFEDLLAWQATHDPLTRLPNRSQLISEINEALTDREADLGVLFFDLDDFKVVNDTLGHRAGDELLLTVAARLRATVRDQDRVFRFAGDEFVVLAHEVGDDAQALSVADRLREQVTLPVVIDGQTVSVGCSVGIVRASESSTAEEMVRDADVAMYRAKRSGKGSAAVFDLSLRRELDRHVELVALVRSTLDAGTFDVAYRISAAAGSLDAIGVDLSLAIPRHWPDEWQSTTLDEVFAAIEQAKLDAELIAFLVGRGATDLVAIRTAIGPCRVSIGVTPEQMLTPGLVDRIARTLLARGLSSHDLELRLPEDGWTPSDVGLVAVVDELGDLGVEVSLDHVGAERTSLVAIGHPAIAGLRLSSSLIDATDAASSAAVAAIITVAHDLGRLVSAPVSSDEQLIRARALGADIVTDATQDAMSVEELIGQYRR